MKLLFGRFGKKETVSIRNPQISTENEGYAFRKSRTLTGSSSSEIRAAGEQRAQIKSPRLKEHELKKHRNVLSLGLFSTLLALTSLAWLVHQFTAGTPEIRSATVLTAGSVDTQRYEKILNDYFASRPLERFRFVLNAESLLGYVQRDAPEVSNIQINGSGSIIGRSNAVLTFREPVVGWQIKNKTYYIDRNGYSFEVSYFGKPSVTVHDASGVSPDDGVIASSRFLSFLGRVVHGVNASGIGTVTKVTLPAGKTRQVDMNLAGKPYRLLLQMDREPTGQVADVVAIVQYMNERQIVPQYVDVRVPSKAYYR